jgi:hypothetical protein
MTLTKLAVSALCIAAVGALVTAVVVQHQSLAQLQDENQALRPQVEQLAQLQAENERLSNMVAVAGNSASLSEQQTLELARLRSEVGKLRAQGNETAKLREENSRIRAEAAVPIATMLQIQANERRDQCINNLALLQAAKVQWAFDNHKQDGDDVGIMDVFPYLEAFGGYPDCPEGGTYVLGAVGEKVRCNVSGHELP